VRVAVYLPLLLALPLSLMARRVAARGTPGLGAWALTGAAVAAAACSTWSLTMLALTMLDDLPPLSALDDHPTLELPEPVPGPVALLAGLLLLAGVVRLSLGARTRVTTYRELRAVGTPGQALVVADWSAPMAVALPGGGGWPAQVLVTTGILRALDADERRVVFAHERAHLARHHHRLTGACAAAAALNPLLIPVRDAVAYLVERWADEDAAAEVADRDLTAQAVARAALATVGAEPVRGRTALNIGGGVATERVRALMQPAPAPRRRRLIAPIALGVTALAVAGFSTVQFVALARAWL
jgi:hypothetical protein